MYFVSSNHLADIFSFIIIDLASSSKLSEFIINGNHEQIKKLFNAAMKKHEALIINADSETKEINRLHHSYQNIIDIAKERLQRLDDEKDYLSKVEKLLWLNLENYNRLRSEYTNENLKEIFKNNLGEPKECEECAKLFIANSPRQKFCSVECRRKATSKR